jgi:hypothetical protein
MNDENKSKDGKMLREIKITFLYLHFFHVCPPTLHYRALSAASDSKFHARHNKPCNDTGKGHNLRSRALTNKPSMASRPAGQR